MDTERAELTAIKAKAQKTPRALTPLEAMKLLTDVMLHPEAYKNFVVEWKTAPPYLSREITWTEDGS